ncbi:MAG: o-succinylbenzoate synthase, partial [Bryobacteraceae bacterium]
MGYRVEQVKLRQIKMPLVHFFETSFSRTYERGIVLVEIVSGGVSGWGEVTAGENPFYNEEWTGSIWPLLTDYVVPSIAGAVLDSAADVYQRLQHIRGHN